MLTRNELMGHFSQMGVAGGTTVIVHSSYKSLGGVEGGPQTVIDVLVELVTPEGAVLFPTFNFSAWTEGHYFDVEHTPSEVGIITELARVDDRFRRTLHRSPRTGPIPSTIRIWTHLRSSARRDWPLRRISCSRSSVPSTGTPAPVWRSRARSFARSTVFFPPIRPLTTASSKRCSTWTVRIRYSISP